MLKYLDSVFIDDALKDDIVTRTAIPDLLNGSEPGYNGVILFGPPGTGKTVLLKAIGEVYEASQNMEYGDIEDGVYNDGYLVGDVNGRISSFKILKSFQNSSIFSNIISGYSNIFSLLMN